MPAASFAAALISTRKYFGEGVGIAVKKGNRQLVEILNYALEQVHASGRYEGLFLRYFPMSFF